MTALRVPRLKVCGIVRPEDLVVCAELGVDAVGLNLWPESPRGRTVEALADLLAEAGDPTGPMRVGVFVDPEPAQVAEARRRLRLDVVQYHGDRLPDGFAELGPYVWVLRGAGDPSRLVVPDPPPAWILVDAHVPGYGGAGVVADWQAARRIVEWARPTPVVLAGGITPDNVRDAIAAVGPAGIDVASGAEVPGGPKGAKDRARIAALVEACKVLGNVAGTHRERTSP